MEEKQTISRNFSPDELRWCRRLERTLKAKPRDLYVYAGLGSIDIMLTDDVDKNDDGEAARKYPEWTQYSFVARIEGDASGL